MESACAHTSREDAIEASEPGRGGPGGIDVFTILGPMIADLPQGCPDADRQYCPHSRNQQGQAGRQEEIVCLSAFWPTAFCVPWAIRP
jgi:hypothetical protein